MSTSYKVAGYIIVWFYKWLVFADLFSDPTLYKNVYLVYVSYYYYTVILLTKSTGLLVQKLLTSIAIAYVLS